MFWSKGRANKTVSLIALARTPFWVQGDEDEVFSSRSASWTATRLDSNELLLGVVRLPSPSAEPALAPGSTELSLGILDAVVIIVCEPAVGDEKLRRSQSLRRKALKGDSG